MGEDSHCRVIFDRYLNFSTLIPIHAEELKVFRPLFGTSGQTQPLLDPS